MSFQKASFQSKLLHQLCSLHGKDTGDVDKIFQLCVAVLGSCLSSIVIEETRLVERVQKKLVQQGRDSDGVRFMELYQKLCSNKGHCLDDASALLFFLFSLMPGGGAKHQATPKASPFLLQSLSFPSIPGSSSAPQQPPGLAPGHAPSPTVPSSSLLSRSSGLGSTVYSSVSRDTVSREVTGLPSGSSDFTIAGGRPYLPCTSTPAPGRPLPLVPPTKGGMSDRRMAWIAEEPPTSEKEVGQSDAVGVKPHPLTQQASERDNEVREQALLQDLIYVFQGIDGIYLRYSSREAGYSLQPQVVVSAPMKEQCYKLAELGWLHRRIRKFVDAMERTRGLVMQSFCVSLSDELKEYYRLVAVLEAQLNQGGAGDGKGLTLQRLAVWTDDPKHRLRVLATVADMCKSVKGGALVSVLYDYSQHGDPAIRSLLLHILSQVYAPLERVLLGWVCEGQLADSYQEFFITSDESSQIDKLWRSKYSIRKAMLPKFISPELAQKILTIGKSINFLRQLCDDYTPLTTKSTHQVYSDLRSHSPRYENSDPFSIRTGPALRALVDGSYRETSQHLLRVLHDKYHLMQHLKALRRYLLLGQGDFINHLMDLMVPYLLQPASVMFQQNLSGILAAAVRATNAQYDWPEALKRLDVRKLDVSPGDKGWDVYSLYYRMDGAIYTIVNHESLMKYLRVFNFLWRGKRMEYCLASMWREQTSTARLLRPLKEMVVVLHQSQLLLYSMVHFISQLQYYMNFEVLECSWARLLTKMKDAKDLDEVIAAHDLFIDELLSQCLLDCGSQELLTQVRTIYDLIIQFQGKQADILEAGVREKERRSQVEAAKERRANFGEWAVTSVEEDLERQKKEEFVREVDGYSADITLLQESFLDHVGSLMEDLRKNSEQSLQFLRFRLDFNQYYSTSLGMDVSVSA